ncbi:MAG: GNAT family N-acetyltransferase [Clostridia bacterium]|nr:GNAT family N-acetyltransferase [Clostridia bacterium]
MRIETERLVITEMTLDMVMDVHLNSLDEDVRRFVPDEVFETPEVARETICYLMEQYSSVDGPLVYAVLMRETGKNIGYVQLVPLGDGKWEIGYHIAKAYTGKGFATEAVKAFLPVITGQLGITEVYGVRLLQNAASGRVLEKCGFKTVFTGDGPYHGGRWPISRSVWMKPAEVSSGDGKTGAR